MLVSKGIRLPSGQLVRFRSKTMFSRIHSGKAQKNVEARIKGKTVGSLAVGLNKDDPGFIYHVGVDPELRRKGIATGMLKHAVRVSPVQVVHSPQRTRDGDKWVKGLKVHVPVAKRSDEGVLMTFAPISKAFFGVPEDDPNFNLPEAVKAYQTVMEMDEDAARFVLSTMVFEKANKEINANKPKIQKFITEFYDKQLEQVTKSLKRAYLTGQTQGKNTESLEQAYEVITKAYEHPRGGNPENAGQFSRFWGSTHRSSHALSYLGRQKPLSDKDAWNLYKIPAPPPKADLSGQRKAEYQQAYQQIAQQLDRYARLIPGSSHGANTEYIFEDGSGRRSSISYPGIVMPDWENIGGLKNKKVAEMHVNVPTDLNVQGASYNLLANLMGDQAAQYGTDMLPQLGDATRKFQESWNSDDYMGASNTDPFYSRLSSASQLVNTLSGKHAYKTKMAAQAGKFVGEHGPDAEKVLGPHVRRSAYRYRGVEKAPAEDVVNSLKKAREMTAGEENQRGIVRRNMLGPLARRGKRPGSPVHMEHGFLVNYLIDRLPTKQLYDLQLKSGVTPPSQGFILDSKGNIVTEAVGYGDDHYLPFNLKNLGKLRGGEYIRTRSVGGPTTEDILVGLMSGARSLTVVSRSGVFSIDFDDTFRGGRRYSDKAWRMTERYGKLLDAVKGGKLILKDTPDDRKVELKEEAKAAFPYAGSETQRNTKYEQLLQEDRDNPKPSKARYTQMMLQAEREGDGSSTREIALMQDKLEEYRKKNRYQTMELNASGYGAAMKSLEEQFPYYFSNVDYRPLQEVERENPDPEKDKGYVKPKYLRPEEALEGYFDPTIVGRTPSGKESLKDTGKITADTANFANWRYNRLRTKLEEKSSPKSSTAASSSTSPAAGTASSPATQQTEAKLKERKQANDLWKLYSGIRQLPSVRYNNKEVPVNWNDENLKMWEGIVGPQISPDTLMTDPVRSAQILQKVRYFAEFDPKVSNLLHEYESGMEEEASQPWDVGKALNGPVVFDWGLDFQPNQSPSEYDRVLRTQPMQEIAQEAEAIAGYGDPETKASQLVREYGRRYQVRKIDEENGRAMSSKEPPLPELEEKLKRAQQFWLVTRRRREAERPREGVIQQPPQIVVNISPDLVGGELEKPSGSFLDLGTAGRRRDNSD